MISWIKMKCNTISFKLFICFFIIWFSFSSLVAGGLMIASMKMTNNTMQNTEDKISYASAMINMDLNRVRDLLYTMCADKEMALFVQERDASFDYNVYLAYYDAYSKLKEYQQTSMYIDDIFLVLPNTNEMLSVNHSLEQIDDRTQAMIDQYRQSQMEFFVQGEKMIYLFQGSNKIMMGIKVSAKHIRDTLKSFESKANYDFFLIDSISRQLLGEDSLKDLDKNLYQIISESEKVPLTAKLGDTEYILEEIKTQSNHFNIIVYSDKKLLYQDVYFIKNLWILLNVAAVCVPILMAVVITKTLQKPMHKLVVAMRKVEKETYDFRLPSEGPSEFRYVFHQYNLMAAKVENLIQEVYEKQLQVQQAKFKQLQAQINPHFLFNSFYMGYRMAKAGDSEKVATLCMYLGDYFKALTYISKEFITVSEDIRFIETYLLLNQMRHPEKLSYEISMEEEVKEVLIPQLLIQPLIENAIRHGLEKINNRCMLRLIVRNDKEKISIIVEDNCNVITEEKIKELKQTLQQEEDPKQSLGLWNVQQRLKAIQKDQEGLELEITEDGIFRISFYLKK